jgi:hypothetical protein
VVYQDLTSTGDVDALRRLTPEHALSLSFLDREGAGALPGADPGGTAVAIVVHTRRGAVAVAAGPGPRYGMGITLGVGYEAGGAGASLLESLEAAALNHTVPRRCVVNICQEAIEYPFIGGEDFNVTLSLGARFRFRAPFSVELLISNGVRGHGEGYRDVNTKEHLIVTYVPLILSGTVGVHLGPVRLAAGPAINRTSWNAIYNSGTEKTTDVSVLGALGEASFQVPVREVAVALRVQGRLFQDARVENPMQVPLSASYRGLVIGLTLVPSQ